MRRLKLSRKKHTPLRHKEWRTGLLLSPPDPPDQVVWAGRMADWSRPTSQRSRGDVSLLKPYAHHSVRSPLCGTPVRRGEGMAGVCVLLFLFAGQGHTPFTTSKDAKQRQEKNEMSGRQANGVSSERQASERLRLQRERYFPAARSRGSSIGSQSSILFPSGSMIQPNLPYSNSSTSPTTVTPSLRNSSRSALRFSTR